MFCGWKSFQFDFSVVLLHIEAGSTCIVTMKRLLPVQMLVVPDVLSWIWSNYTGIILLKIFRPVKVVATPI